VFCCCCWSTRQIKYVMHWCLTRLTPTEPACMHVTPPYGFRLRGVYHSSTDVIVGFCVSRHPKLFLGATPHLCHRAASNVLRSYASFVPQGASSSDFKRDRSGLVIFEMSTVPGVWVVFFCIGSLGSRMLSSECRATDITVNKGI
jgi:hypothetical protein